MSVSFSSLRRRVLPMVCGLAALIGSAALALADITIKADLEDDAKISDIAKITAKITSTEPIDKVEFRVDDELRYTDTSTPYSFDWDTIADKEGKHELSITAFDSNGSTKRTTVNLEVDNELGLGADVLATKAKEALAEKKYDAAILYGRRALKAEPGNIVGSRAIASVYGMRRDWGKAIATLDKAMGLDSSAAGMSELASYRVQRALEPDNAANFFAELSSANELRRKSADLAIADIKKSSAGNSEAIGDALLQAGRVREAIAEYSKIATKADAPLSASNRLALAYCLADQPQEAMGILRPLQRSKKDDAASRAIMGLAHLRMTQFAEARQAVQADLADQRPASLIIAAFADNALGKAKEAAAFAKDAVALAPTASEAHYALALAAPNLKDQEREINRTIGLNHFQSGPYLDYASRLTISKRTDRYDQALNLTDLVLKNEPDNFNAKLMQAQLYLALKRMPDAETALSQLGRMRGATSNPDFQLTLASYWDMKNNGAQVNAALAAARKLDAVRFDRRGVTPAFALMNELNRKMFLRSGYFLMPTTVFPQN
jgi:tetratricopeptide (TPR) repeat protein